MYCKKCGKKNADSAKFCFHCGAKLEELIEVPDEIIPKETEKTVEKEYDRSKSDQNKEENVNPEVFKNSEDSLIHLEEEKEEKQEENANIIDDLSSLDEITEKEEEIEASDQKEEAPDQTDDKEETTESSNEDESAEPSLKDFLEPSDVLNHDPEISDIELTDPSGNEPETKKKTVVNKRLLIVIAVIVLIVIAAEVVTYPERKLEAYQEVYDGLDDKITPYILDDDDQDSYDEKKKTFKNAISSEDLDACENANADLEELESDLKEEAEDQVSKLQEEIENSDTSEFSEEALYNVDQYRKSAEECLEENDYATAITIFTKCKDIIDGNAINASSTYYSESDGETYYHIESTAYTDNTNKKSHEELTEIENDLRSLIKEYNEIVFNVDENTEDFTSKLDKMYVSDNISDNNKAQNSSIYKAFMENDIAYTYKDFEETFFTYQPDTKSKYENATILCPVTAKMTWDELTCSPLYCDTLIKYYFIKEDGEWKLWKVYWDSFFATGTIKVYNNDSAYQIVGSKLGTISFDNEGDKENDF